MKTPLFNLRSITLAISATIYSLMVTAQITPTDKMKTLKSSGLAPVNGLKMYYEIHGEGKPIVLLHGSYMTIDRNYGQIIPELAKAHKVIALEMQGHGRTADIDRPVSYKAMADDVSALLKYLKIDSADILGYSLGGTVAFQFAIDHPQQVSKLIIISSVYKFAGWGSEARAILKNMKPEFLTNTPLKTEYDRIAPDPANWVKFLTKFIQFNAQEYDLGDDNIKNIKAPILFIMGDNDGIAIEFKASMYKLCGGDVFADLGIKPKSFLAIFPGSSHQSLMVQTDKLISTINPFLEGKSYSPSTSN